MSPQPSLEPDRTSCAVLQLASLRAARYSRHLPGSRAATHDPRWPRITAALADLREQRRFAIRIVDAHCGTGCLLIDTVHHARALGFTAVEGLGIDLSPTLIGRARVAADRVRDRGVGLSFAMADLAATLGEERDLPPDIVLWGGAPSRSAYPPALVQLAAAGALVIGEPAA
jgi:SAM-dependent methyltransferase